MAALRPATPGAADTAAAAASSFASCIRHNVSIQRDILAELREHAQRLATAGADSPVPAHRPASAPAPGAANLARLRMANRDTQEALDSLSATAAALTNPVRSVAERLATRARLVAQLHNDRSACDAFMPQHDDVTVLSMSDFQRLAPASLLSGNLHLREVNRLMFELAERRRLRSMVGDVRKSSRAMRLRLTEKANMLKLVQRRVHHYFEITTELRSAIPSVVRPTDPGEQALLERLPAPLFVIFNQARVFRDSEDSTVAIRIIHDTSSEGIRSSAIVHAMAVEVLFPLSVASEGLPDQPPALVIQFFYFLDLQAVGVIIIGAQSLRDQSWMRNWVATVFADEGVSSLHGRGQIQDPDSVLEDKHTSPIQIFRWAQRLGGIEVERIPQQQSTSILGFAGLVRRAREEYSKL